MKSNLTCSLILSTVQGSLHKHASGLNIPLIIACLAVCRLAPISNGSHDSAKLTEISKISNNEIQNEFSKRAQKAYQNQTTKNIFLITHKKLH